MEMHRVVCSAPKWEGAYTPERAVSRLPSSIPLRYTLGLAGEPGPGRMRSPHRSPRTALCLVHEASSNLTSESCSNSSDQAIIGLKRSVVLFWPLQPSFTSQTFVPCIHQNQTFAHHSLHNQLHQQNGARQPYATSSSPRQGSLPQDQNNPLLPSPQTLFCKFVVGAFGLSYLSAYHLESWELTSVAIISILQAP